MDVQASTSNIPNNTAAIGPALLATWHLRRPMAQDTDNTHDFQKQLAAAAESMRDQKAHQAAEDFVATSFIQPLLAEARRDPLKVDMFHGGQAEEAFGQQLDVILAGRVVHKANLPIVDSIYRGITRSSSRRSSPVADPQIPPGQYGQVSAPGFETHG